MSTTGLDFVHDRMPRIVVLDHHVSALLGTARLKIQPLPRYVALLITLRHFTNVPEQGQVPLLRPHERDRKGRVMRLVAASKPSQSSRRTSLRLSILHR